ncbi:CHAT domain-containing tetratricopeptide repeat protein [Streptomyces torulosus]|uniref:CHAT domain-containing tetratricopeptide repeat protein n=1 Tax=Streptomyces torulosus TaxID=68276 RepID=UPI0006EB9B87|nr:CHAT domain-containing protein [Streptomyces torulosus]
MNEEDAVAGQRLLMAVRQRIARFGETRDPDLLTCPEADAELAALAAATDLEADLESRSALGVLHWLRHLVLNRDPDELAQAVALLAPLCESTPDLVPEPLRRHPALSRSPAPESVFDLLDAYRADGDLARLHQAVDLLRQSLAETSAEAKSEAATQADAGERATALANLGAALLMLADHTGGAHILSEGLACCRKAVKLTPRSDPARAGRLANLAQALAASGAHRPGRRLLDGALAVMRQAVSETPDDAPELPGRLSFLADVPHVCYTRTGDVGLLHEALAMTRASVAPGPAGPQSDPRIWTNHAAALSALHTRTRDADVLREAVAACRMALGRFGPRDPARCHPAGNLAMCLLARYEALGDTEALAEAETLLRDACAARGTAPPVRSALLSGLGLVLRSRAEVTGDLDLLAEAVAVGRVSLTGPLNPAHRVAALANLSLSLHMSYQATGDTALLEQAVARGADAVASTPDAHPDRAGRLANLGIVLRGAAERTGDLAQVERGIAVCREAAARTPDTDPDRPAVLSTLGLLLRLRGAAGDDDSLREAVRVMTEVADATEEGNPDLPGRLSNLMIVLRAQYDASGAVTALHDAVTAGRRALAALPSGHGNRSSVLANLGLAMSTLASRTGDDRTLAEAAEVYAEASRSPGAPVVLRIWALREEARIVAQRGDPGAALPVLETAVSLLPRLAGRALDRPDRDHALGRVGGLAAQVVSTAVAVGRVAYGVGLLERARGVLLTESILERSADLEALTAVAPELATEFTRLRREYDADAGPGVDLYTPDGSRAAAAATRRARLDEKWNALLARIREQDGMQDFLDPGPPAEPHRMSADGPLVYVYAAEEAGGAVILPAGSGAPRHVPCDGANAAAAAHQAEAFDTAVRVASTAAGYGERLRAHREMNRVLEWLWDTVAEPVLTALADTDGADGGVGVADGRGEDGTVADRLWWCPVGVFTMLPLHAAGYHRQRSGRTVMDRTTSSYTPTLRALDYARRGAAPDAGSGLDREAGPDADAVDALLLVSVAEPPDAPPLPGAERETEALRALLPDCTVLSAADARHDAVLTALEARRTVHFACHAVADPRVPSRSRLVLCDHRERPLTVREIAGVSNPAGALCYLSACATTKAAPRLADEFVHITSAFQLAGFSHVIGTLWPVSDVHAATVATRCYEALRGPGSTLETWRAAAAVSAAARSVRDIMPGSPLHWAGHVHWGT